MEKDNLFLSCDWGTTAFRLRLVSAEGFRILAESESKEGNASVFEAWKETGKAEEERFSFYLDIVKHHLAQLKAKAGQDLDGIPLIISGMASSTVGMMELPYKPMPFALDGSDLDTKRIAATEDFPNPILLISGVRTDDDVMRGEEVQIVGCGIEATDEEQLIIHPGTHCKHIVVKGGKAVSFQTYMTGEMFSLLSTKSILASSVEAGGDFEEEKHKAYFEAGVLDAGSFNLLHEIFMVRTSVLFGKRSKQENFYYLSGLLIGSELNAFSRDFIGPIILAGEPALVTQYKLAMNVCGITGQASKVTIKEADAITLAGQYAVHQHQKMS